MPQRNSSAAIGGRRPRHRPPRQVTRDRLMVGLRGGPATGSTAGRATAIISMRSLGSVPVIHRRSFRPPSLFDSVHRRILNRAISFACRLLIAAYLVEAGLLLIVAPWMVMAAELLCARPPLGGWMANEFVRGAISVSG